MWIADLNFDELLSFFQGELVTKAKEVRGREGLHLPSNIRGYLVAWKSDPKGADKLPRLIVGDEKKLDDLLAWLSAYLSDLAPFTAFCRTMTREQAAVWFSREVEVATDSSQKGMLGLVLAETFCRTRGADLLRVSPYACLRSFSFVAMRSLAVGYAREDFERVFEAWARLKQIEETREDDRLLSHLRLLWTVAVWFDDFADNLAGAAGSPRDDLEVVQGALRDIARLGDVSDDRWNNVTRDAPAARRARAEMKKTREERVVAFEGALAAMRDAPSSPIYQPFILGYLASRIAPGSFDHFALLSPLMQSLPGAILWYGVLGGLAENSSVGTAFRGLGARVAREAYRLDDPLEPPRADVSLRELEVLSRSARWRGRIRSMSKESLNVELLPGINTYMTLVEEPSSPKPSQVDLFKEADSAVPTPLNRLTELRRLIEQAKHQIDDVVRQVEGATNRPAKRGNAESRSKASS